MTVAGFSIFGGVWLLTALIGADLFDRAEEDFQDAGDVANQQATGRRLMIPLGGPFAASATAPTATSALFSVLSGVAQVAGLGVGIGGAVIYGRTQRQYRVSLTGTPMAGGGAFRVGLRF